MDVGSIALGGMTSGLTQSVCWIFLTMFLYVKYTVDDYAAKNVPSEALMSSYDFIIVGGGSAGTFSIINLMKNITKISVSVRYLRTRMSALLLV